MHALVIPTGDDLVEKMARAFLPSPLSKAREHPTLKRRVTGPVTRIRA
jgi:hypothetical protein